MWTCSKCQTEFEGSFCGKCGTSRTENVPGQPMPEVKDHQKGKRIAIVVLIAGVALLVAVLVMAIHLILGNMNRQENGEAEVEPEVYCEYEVEYAQPQERESPFCFEVWRPSDSAQVELEGIVLDVPVPPNTVIREDEREYSVLFEGEEYWEDWFHIQIMLRNVMDGDFRVYSNQEVDRIFEWHRSWANVIDFRVVKERDATLMITHWEDEYGEGFSFSKIGQYQEAIFMVELRFETVENREEFFEAFGLMNRFQERIESALEDIQGGGLEGSSTADPSGQGSDFQQQTPIFVAVGGGRSYVITEDGVLWTFGYNRNLPEEQRVSPDGQPVAIMEDVVFVSANDTHTMAITEDGVLWAWGSNGYGQLGNGDQDWGFVAAGEWTFPPVPVMENVTYVSAGSRHTMAITDGGTLWGWGHNRSGQLGLGTGGYWEDEHSYRLTPVQIMENVSRVSAGSVHTMAITYDGELWGWGSNRGMYLGIGTDDWNDERLREGLRLAPILVMEDVVDVSASPTHTMAVTSDGTLWAWGGNNNGQFIDSDILRHPAPVPIMEGVESVAIRWGRTRVIDRDGVLWSWGDNRRGSVGDGTTQQRLTPVAILENIVMVSGGSGSHTLAIDSDGVLWAWGNNGSGQLGDGSDVEYRTYPVRVN